jgi:hypothetical protein
MKKNLKYALQSIPAFVELVFALAAFSMPQIAQSLFCRVIIGTTIIICASLLIIFVHKEKAGISTILAMLGQIVAILVMIPWIILGVPLLQLVF